MYLSARTYILGMFTFPTAEVLPSPFVASHFYNTEMTKDNIDEVVLVGGTTRIPKVKQQLRCVL